MSPDAPVLPVVVCFDEVLPLVVGRSQLLADVGGVFSPHLGVVDQALAQLVQVLHLVLAIWNLVLHVLRQEEKVLNQVLTSKLISWNLYVCVMASPKGYL